MMKYVDAVYVPITAAAVIAALKQFGMAAIVEDQHGHTLTSIKLFRDEHTNLHAQFYFENEESA